MEIWTNGNTQVSREKEICSYRKTIRPRHRSSSFPFSANLRGAWSILWGRSRPICPRRWPPRASPAKAARSPSPWFFCEQQPRKHCTFPRNGTRENGFAGKTQHRKLKLVAVQRRLLLVAFSRDCRLRQTARKKKRKHNGARFEKSRARKITRIELWDERKITNA